MHSEKEKKTTREKQVTQLATRHLLQTVNTETI